MKHSHKHPKNRKDQADDNQSSESGSSSSSWSKGKIFSKSKEQNSKKDDSIVESLLSYLKFIKGLEKDESNSKEVKAHIEELRGQVNLSDHNDSKVVSEIKAELQEIENRVDQKIVLKRRDKARVSEMRSQRSSAGDLSKRAHEKKLFNVRQSSKRASENVGEYLKKIPGSVREELSKAKSHTSISSEAKQLLSSKEMHRQGKRMLEAIEKSRESVEKLTEERESLTKKEKNLTSKVTLTMDELNEMSLVPSRISDIEEELERKRKEEEELELAEKEKMALKIAVMQAKFLEEKDKLKKNAEAVVSEANKFEKLLAKLTDRFFDPALIQEARDIGDSMQESLSRRMASMKNSFLNMRDKTSKRKPKSK